MIVEIYDALLDAGAADDKARRAAEAMAGHEDRFNRVEMAIAGVEARLDAKIDRLDAKIDKVELRLHGEQVVARWMLGTIIAFLAAIVLKLFVH